MLLLKEPTFKNLNHEIENQLTDLDEYEKDIAYSDKCNDQLISAKFR